MLASMHHNKILISSLTALIPVLTLRVTALVDTGVELSSVLCRGLASDLASALIALALIQAMSKLPLRGAKTRWIPPTLATLGFLIWFVICYGNYEHILANDANVALSNAKYMKSKTFLSGSAFHVSRPVIAGISLLASLACLARWLRGGKLSISWAPYATTALLITLLWPLERSELTWLQEHPVQGLFSSVEVDDELSAPARTDEEIERRLAPDLSGELRVPLPKGERKPNVLIIMLEGGTGANITPFANFHQVKIPEIMPLMSDIAKKNIGASTFISHQRQTDRGEYALLCGDYPKLNRLPPKMTDIATAKAPHRCLPQFLGDHGYHTVYLQPAPMSFMMKDRFMEKIGFHESRGADFFNQGYERGGWGIDDRAFFEKSFEVFKELEKGDKPWMAALMTVGTHHPLIVPKSFRRKGKESKMSRALRYTDKYLKSLLDQMRRAKMLDNTLVLITSDESRGFKKVGGITRRLSQNWSFLIALTPTKDSKQINEPYHQSDLALSVIDYVGLGAKKHDFIGRSLFRSYPEAREMPMSNIFFHRSYLFTPDRKLAICTEDLRKCSYYQRKDDRFFGPGWDEIGAQTQLKYDLGRYVNWSTADRIGGGSFRPKMSMATLKNSVIELTQKPRERQWVFGGQFLSAPAGKRARVEIDFELIGEPHAVVKITSRLDLEHRYKHKLPPAEALKVGDRYHISYRYSRDEPIRQLEHILWAWRLNNARARLLVHKAEIIFEDLPEGEDPTGDLEDVKLTLSRRINGEWRKLKRASRGEYSIFESERFQRHHCVKRSPQQALLAEECPRGSMILGPRVEVPAESDLNARLTLTGVKGSGEVRLKLYDLTPLKKPKLLAQTDPISVKASEVRELSINHLTSALRESVELRLVIVKSDSAAPLSFQITAGALSFYPQGEGETSTRGASKEVSPRAPKARRNQSRTKSGLWKSSLKRRSKNPLMRKLRNPKASRLKKSIRKKTKQLKATGTKKVRSRKSSPKR